MQNNFLVKICGIRRAEDYAVAEEAGADLIGLVFYPKSPRAVSIKEAEWLAEYGGWKKPRSASRGAVDLSQMCKTERPVRVGVFVEPKYDEVVTAAEAGLLGAIQLHGAVIEEGERAAADLGLPYIRAIQIQNTPSEEQFTLRFDAPELYLCDTYHKEHWGGTGEIFQHEVLRPWLGRFPILLAGGLTADNVSGFVRNLPGLAGCDVSSGVEKAPGVKDAEKVRRFIKEARQGALAARVSAG